MRALVVSLVLVAAPAQADVRQHTLRASGATFHVEIEDARRRVSDAQVLAWVRRSAALVADYCGRFPVPELRVQVTSRLGSGTGWGRHWRGERIRVSLGRRTTEETLRRDWVMVHEMLHTAFPDLRPEHRWMEEGLSTYLETVLRARAGILTEQEVWSRWVERMPHGRPREGDRGLEHTRTWGRTYWGGALFWMMVDLEMRQRSGGTKSIQDVVRGVLAAGGSSRARWSPARAVRVADRATGTDVLRELFARMAERPGDVDLDALWERLGVVVEGDEVRGFDDDAPLAGVRRAMNAM